MFFNDLRTLTVIPFPQAFQNFIALPDIENPTLGRCECVLD
jgi:hypothetical protein